MPDCPTCGLPYTEGARTCPACGGKLPFKVKQSVCKVCGNTLLETDSFCSLCGTAIETDTASAAELLAKKEEEQRNPTMDEIQIPVITDEMLGIGSQPKTPPEDMPTMDSVSMPGQEPAPKPAPAAPKPAPVITPQEQALAQQTVTVQPTPTVSETPRPQPSPVPQPQPVIPPQGQQPQAVITPEGQRVAPPPQQPQPPQYTASHNSNYQPGKSTNNIIPIILAICIVLVILFDVFVLFRKQIFGDKDSSKSSAAIVTVTDLEGPELPELDLTEDTL